MLRRMHTFVCTGPIWLWSNGVSPASRHFFTVPADISQAIHDIAVRHPRKGFGSQRVSARIGYHTRETSIFPDKTSGCFLLPIKATVRTMLHISAGDEVCVELVLALS